MKSRLTSELIQALIAAVAWIIWRIRIALGIEKR